MDGVDEREQVSFLKWTHRPDVRALGHELGSMFHRLGSGKHYALASNRLRAPKCTLHAPALLMLAHGYDDAGLAIGFASATGSAVERERELLRHLSWQGWISLFMRTAGAVRLASSRYLDMEVLPL